MTTRLSRPAAQPSPPDSGTPVLEARDVAVHFGGVKAVDAVSVQLQPGKIFGIIGPNGSGKSTLLGAVTRLTKLTRGVLLFDGEEYQTASPASMARRGMARTFQTVRLLQDLTVRENVELGADVDRLGRTGGLGALLPSRAVAARRAARADEAIERTGLGDYVKLRPGELSYGVQRRVEIARAIAADPRLLLLDEPTAGMNHHERQEVSELLKRLRAEELTQVLVEHDVQMMVDTCNYLYAMNFGRMIAQGDPKAVVREPAVQEAYLGKRWREHA
jgi:branched-chain amino acid transport system ATP-binding protein